MWLEIVIAVLLLCTTVGAVFALNVWHASDHTAARLAF